MAQECFLGLKETSSLARGPTECGAQRPTRTATWTAATLVSSHEAMPAPEDARGPWPQCSAQHLESCCSRHSRTRSGRGAERASDTLLGAGAWAASCGNALGVALAWGRGGRHWLAAHWSHWGSSASAPAGLTPGGSGLTNLGHSLGIRIL